MIAGAASLLWVVSAVVAPPTDGSAVRAPRVDAPDAKQLVLDVVLDPALAENGIGPGLLRFLRAELAAANVVIGDDRPPSSSAAQARLTVGAVAGAEGAVSLTVEYRETATVVHRTLDRASLPPDGVLLAIAVAVDELIRATRPLGEAPTTPRTPPPPPVPAPAAPVVEARALFSGERHADGVAALGPDAVVALLLGTRLSVDARVGWRRADARAAPDGSIDSTALVLGIGARLAVPARAVGQRAGAEVAARLDAARVTVSGTASAGGATTHNAFGLAAVAGLGAWLTLIDPLHVVAFAGWQVPLRSVTATDASQPAGKVFHPGLSLAVGVGARF